MQEIFEDEIVNVIKKEKDPFNKMPAMYVFFLLSILGIIVWFVTTDEKNSIIFNAAISCVSSYISFISLYMSMQGNKDWKEIYVKEKRIREKYKRVFDSIEEIKKGCFVQFPPFIVFAEYYKDLFGTELQSLKELNIQLVDFDLTARRKLCEYNILNCKVSNRISNMVNEDLIITKKWYMFLCQAEIQMPALDNKSKLDKEKR